MEDATKSPTSDGAGEKFIDEEQHLEKMPKENSVDAKFIPGNQNGETKVDCDNIRRAFVGMGKEELMKFANDPFWVKTRWFLFVLFWLTWIAMLAGAIAIVLYAPKCSAPVEIKKVKGSVIYEMNVGVFQSDDQYTRVGYLGGLQDNLDHFKYLGIDTILINSLMEGMDKDPSTVKDFMKIDSIYGSFEILKNLAAKMNEKGMRLIMNFIPNYSSDTHIWFRNSVAKIDPYTDYYVWAKGSYSSDGDIVPPNNWVSVYGNSTWTWAKERKQFYLHQFHAYQPDLNFQNPAVVEIFEDVFSSWLNHGLNGFYLNKVKFLVEDSKLENETINSPGSGTHTDYSFYNHHKTTHLPESHTVVNSWADFINKHSGILYASDLNYDNKASNYISHHVFKIGPEITAKEVHNFVKNQFSFPTPTWQWKCKVACPDEKIAKGLLSAFLLLPGTVFMSGGEELKWSTNLPWNFEDVPSFKFDQFLEKFLAEKSEMGSNLNTIKYLISLRNLPALNEGETETAVLNSTVFGFTRSLANKESYLFLMNFGDDSRTINCSNFKGMASSIELELVVSVPSETPTKLGSGSINLNGKEIKVFKYTPTSIEGITYSENVPQTSPPSI